MKTWTEIRYAGMLEADRYFYYNEFKKQMDGSIDAEGLTEEEFKSLVRARKQMRSIAAMFTDVSQNDILDASLRVKIEEGNVHFFI